MVLIPQEGIVRRDLKSVDLGGCVSKFETGRDSPGISSYLDSLGIKCQAFLLIHKELLNVFALIALKLNHLTHLGIVNDGAIAS